MDKNQFHLLGQHANNNELFFDELERILGIPNSDGYSELVKYINDNKQINICQISVRAVSAGKSIFVVINLLNDIFPFLSHKINSLYLFFKTCHYEMKNDFLFDKQYRLLDKLYHKQPEIVNSLLDRLLRTNDEFVINYIASIYSLRSITEFEAIHNELIKLASETSNNTLQGVILALSKLDYLANDKSRLTEHTIRIYGELIKRNSESINSSIAFSLKPFLFKSIKARNQLLKLSRLKESNTQYQISKILDSIYIKFRNTKWFQKLINSFIETSCNQVNILKQLDLVFSNQIKDLDNFTIFENFLHSWILKSDFQESSINVNVIWRSTLISLEHNNDLMTRLITNLFNSDEPIAHIVVRDFINALKQNNKENIALNREVLDKLKYNDILYVCRKIIGYLFSAEEIYQLLDSIINHFSEDDKTTNLICSIYSGFLAKDYLSTTKGLIEDTIQQLPSTKSLLNEKLKTLVNELKTREEEKNALPILRELESSKKQHYQIAIEESKKIRKLMEISQKDL